MSYINQLLNKTPLNKFTISLQHGTIGSHAAIKNGCGVDLLNEKSDAQEKLFPYIYLYLIFL